MSCPRCEELEAEVAYLKGELGIRVAADVTNRLRRALLQFPAGNTGGRTQAAECLAALYSAKGRTVSTWNLMTAVPGPDRRGEDRCRNIVTVWVHIARRALGSDVIESVYGQGYRLTEIGMAKVAALLGEAPPQ